LRPERIKHWLSVGALPSERCGVLFKKYMAKFEALEAEQKAAAAAAAAAPAS
jgi:ribosomal protein S16